MPAAIKDVLFRAVQLALGTQRWEGAGNLATLEMEIFFLKFIFFFSRVSFTTQQMGFNFFSHLPSSFPALGNFSKKKIATAHTKNLSEGIAPVLSCRAESLR